MLTWGCGNRSGYSFVFSFLFQFFFSSRERKRHISAILQTQLNATSYRKPSRNLLISQRWSPFSLVSVSQGSKRFPSCVAFGDVHGLSSPLNRSPGGQGLPV